MPSYTANRSDELGMPAQAAGLLFWLGLGLCLLTRFVALDKFPIYFFSDEAIQTMSAVDLIDRGFRDTAGNLFPAYFENGQQFNLSLSVWLQVLIAWLPRSVWLTRGLPALISLAFPLSAGLWAKDFFRSKTWWLAPYVVIALPAWFLHSRTAFETSLGVSFYSLFLFFYLKYRLRSPKFLPLVLLFGACAFYSYAPLQLVVTMTGLILLIWDWRYHFSSKKAFLAGFLTLALLALPYFRFRLVYPQALAGHLHLLRSYWLSRIPLHQKLLIFVQKWINGFNPAYWFFPNQIDLARHQMKGIGHLPWFFLPACLVGFGKTVATIKEAPYRLTFIALFAGPLGAALVDISITRVLVMNLPFALLILTGFDWALKRMQKHPRLKTAAAFGIMLALTIFSVAMCLDAVREGPTWYPDYGLYGMQWGGRQISEKIETYLQENPDARLTLSPSWANNTDVIMRYFLDDPLPITIGTPMEYNLYYQEIQPNQVFVICAEEYEWLRENPKFEEIKVLDRLKLPDGKAGFYFVKFVYSPEAKEIFAREMEERSKPEEVAFDLFGQRVQIEHSRLDLGTIANAFDGNPATPLRTLEANPLEIRVYFSEPIELQRVSALVGAPATRLSVQVTTPDGETHIFSQEAGRADVVRQIGTDFGKVLAAASLKIQVESLGEAEPTHVHLWELLLE
jgi:hypothetical protein